MITLPPAGAVAVSYARYSTNHQDDRSLEGQHARCTDFISRRDWIKSFEYSDAAKSGSAMHQRAGLYEMMAAAARGEFQVAVFEDLDRISRDIVDSHTLYRDLTDLGIILVSVVTGNALSEEEVAIKSLINSQYLRQGRDKTRRGMELVMRQGRLNGSVAYGYRKKFELDIRGEPIRGLREIDPDEAPVVRRAYDGYLAGVSPIALCRAFNEEGIPGPGGGQWTSGALTGSPSEGDGLFRNRLYVGEARFGRTKVQRRKGKVYQTIQPDETHMVTQHPELAIIDRETFEAVQQKLKERGREPYHRQKRPEYLLSGLVVCGECGHSYTIQNGKLGCTGRLRGVCTNSRRVSREGLEAALLDELKEHLLAPGLLDLALDEYRTAAAAAAVERDSRARRRETHLQEVTERLGNLIAKLGQAAGSAYAADLLLAEVDKLGAEKARLEFEAKLARPVLRAALLPTDQIVQRIAVTVSHLQQALESSDVEAVRAREQLRACIDEIVVNPAPGSALDGRGAGPVTISVRGQLSEFLKLSDLRVDRNFKHQSGTQTVLEGMVLEFSFSFLLKEGADTQLFADLPIIARLLDEASVPVTFRSVEAALAARPALAPSESDKADHWRTTSALNHLRATGAIRRITGGPRWKGWVWEDSNLTDEQWRARVYDPEPDKLRPPPRIIAPEAKVVVISSGQTEDEPSPG